VTPKRHLREESTVLMRFDSFPMRTRPNLHARVATGGDAVPQAVAGRV
jgi:hypothetical protein